jgi:hypothetical protein
MKALKRTLDNGAAWMVVSPGLVNGNVIWRVYDGHRWVSKDFQTLRMGERYVKRLLPGARVVKEVQVNVTYGF